MSVNAAANWKKEFGIDKRTHPNFFSSKDDLTKSVLRWSRKIGQVAKVYSAG